MEVFGQEKKPIDEQLTFVLRNSGLPIREALKRRFHAFLEMLPTFKQYCEMTETDLEKFVNETYDGVFDERGELKMILWDKTE